MEIKFKTIIKYILNTFIVFMILSLLYHLFPIFFFLEPQFFLIKLYGILYEGIVLFILLLILFQFNDIFTDILMILFHSILYLSLISPKIKIKKKWIVCSINIFIVSITIIIILLNHFIINFNLKYYLLGLLGIIIFLYYLFILNLNKHKKEILKSFKEVYSDFIQTIKPFQNYIISTFMILIFISVYMKSFDSYIFEKAKIIINIFEYSYYALFIIWLISLLIPKLFKIKLKNKKTKSNKFSKIALKIFPTFSLLFIIIIGISIIFINKTSDDKISYSELNCSSVIKSYPNNMIFIKENSNLDCILNLSYYNISSNYSIKYSKKWNGSSIYNISINNKTGEFIVEIPNISSELSFKIIKDTNKTIKEIPSGQYFYVVDYEKYIEVEQEKQSRIIIFFISGWICLFILFDFMIRFRDWIREG